MNSRKEGEADRLREAEVLTTTFQTAKEQLNRLVQNRRGSAEKRLAMADIRGRFRCFGYMKRALSEAFGQSRAPHEQDLSGVPLKNQTSAQLRRLR